MHFACERAKCEVCIICGTSIATHLKNYYSLDISVLEFSSLRTSSFPPCESVKIRLNPRKWRGLWDILGCPLGYPLAWIPKRRRYRSRSVPHIHAHTHIHTRTHTYTYCRFFSYFGRRMAKSETEPSLRFHSFSSIGGRRGGGSISVASETLERDRWSVNGGRPSCIVANARYPFFEIINAQRTGSGPRRGHARTHAIRMYTSRNGSSLFTQSVASNRRPSRTCPFTDVRQRSRRVFPPSDSRTVKRRNGGTRKSLAGWLQSRPEDYCYSARQKTNDAELTLR